MIRRVAKATPQERRAAIYLMLRHSWRFVAIGAVAVLLTLSIVQSIRVDALRQAVRDERADSAAAAQRAVDRSKDQQSTIDALADQNKRLLMACQQSADCLGKVPPQVIEGTPGATGAKGDAGRGISYAVCQANGTFIVAYTDGTTTDAGSCRGQDGTNGQNGSNGSAGQNGTNGQDGAPGATGPQGPSGQDGRGISSATCGDDGRWTITYTDGTTSDGGDCRVGLLG